MRSWHGGGLWFLWCYLVGRIARIARVQALDFISDFGERMILRDYDRHHLLIQLRLGRLQYSASCNTGLFSPLVCLSSNTMLLGRQQRLASIAMHRILLHRISSFLFNRIAIPVLCFMRFS